jgi:hypothetical protein
MADGKIVGQLGYPLVDLRFCLSAPAKRVCDVAIDVHVRKKCAALKDQADSPVLHLLICDVPVVEQHAARIRSGQTRYDFKQDTLAYACLAQQNEVFPLLDVE